MKIRQYLLISLMFGHYGANYAGMDVLATILTLKFLESNQMDDPLGDAIREHQAAIALRQKKGDIDVQWYHQIKKSFKDNFAINLDTYDIRDRIIIDPDYHVKVMREFDVYLLNKDFGAAKRWLENYFRELTLLNVNERFSVIKNYNPDNLNHIAEKDRFIQIYLDDWKKGVKRLFRKANGAGDVSQDWYMEMGKTLMREFGQDIGRADVD